MKGAAFLLLAAVGAAAAGPARDVNPFIGTGGHGHTYPGASWPFGMVQLSPDTRLTGWDGCSGYHDSDELLHGFSHTHLSGTGVSDYGDILLLPFADDVPWHNGPDGYSTPLDKSSERAHAGSYAVHLPRPDIDVELTATARSGVHRYRFHRPKAGMLVDLTHRDEVLASSVRVVDAQTIEGMRRSRAWALDQVVYFVARFSQPILHYELARNLAVVPNANELEGPDLRAKLHFGDVRELTVQVALSSVDLAGARANLEAERVRDFASARRAAEAAWDRELGKIRVFGGDATQRRIFTTALYHSLLAPNLFSDVDGRYRGMDGRTQRAEGRDHYTVFSLWDTFRATHPLLALHSPERTADFLATFLAQFAQSGRLPVWELAANETNCMIGYHSVSVIADALAWGIDDFDLPAALVAMRSSAESPVFGLPIYATQGFLSTDDESESVSKTLEYAYDDWCIARTAERMGESELAARFFERSQGWRHLLDPETGFFRPRSGQGWLSPFDPYRVDNHFTEANAWQYSMFVPHDLPAFIAASGGDEAFLARLDELFAAEPRTTGREQADITGLIGQYAHGNEPSHHMAWLHAYAGRPQSSPPLVHRILRELYRDAPDGLSGNEDCGQMSSWYVWSALGLYPVCPGSGELVIGLPLFARAELQLPAGRKLRIVRRGAGMQIAGVRWNGVPLSRSFLRYSELLAGGELTIQAGPASSDFGKAPQDRPGRQPERAAILAAPFVAGGELVFRQSTSIRLASADAGAAIEWSLDARSWQPYVGAIECTQSADLHFRARDQERMSPTLRVRLHRIPNDWQATTITQPRPQYTAGGAQALVDGLRGPREWRIGGWQGYQDADLDVVVDLGEQRPLHRVGAGFLQDVRSWIWMPEQVTISVSLDGVDFQQVAELSARCAVDDYEVTIDDLTAELDVTARYVRVFARNLGTIPPWHPGAGDQCFIFVDEILIE